LVPCHSFAACKKSLQLPWKSLGHFSPIILPFSARGLSRHLCAERAWRGQVISKAGWYNQPIGCSVHGGETHPPYSKRRRTVLHKNYVSVHTHKTKHRLKTTHSVHYRIVGSH
jgi:hypothetical protein